MSDLAKIEEIYHAALSVPVERREDFVREACAGDEQLLREVESFLALTEKAGSFIESPPGDLAAALMENKNDDENLIGREFGHYRLLSLLGAGGMGKVYLAEDTRLGRKIALKLLPSQLSASSERKKRFEQEARSASALNHPNIITIHGIEESDGFSFIATEFIDGETLRERLELSPLEVGETLDIGIQLASALEAAHAVGIIHRDIKPANIMLRRDGIAKVLDFGLAKLTTGSSSNFDTKDLTGQRRVMGTINYMSPEQALGEKLDARTDIFSLGVVLYEMLSGASPFAGESEGAVYNATINKNPPPLRKLNPAVPAKLEHIVNRMMAKNLDQRYQTAGELRRDLQQLTQTATGEKFAAFSTGFQPPGVARRKIVFPLITAAVFLLAGAAIYLAYFNQKNAANTPDAAKNLNFTQLTSGGNAVLPSLSPDGKTIVFSSRQSGNWDIYLQRVGGSNAINLTEDSPADELQAVYSPDGEQIAFSSNREGESGIYIMGATGENVRKVSDFGFTPAWSPDGKEIAFSETTIDDPTARYLFPAALYAVNLATGEQRKLTDGDAAQPHWSPTGERIAFWSMDKAGIRDIRTVSRAGGEPVPITDDSALDWNPVWSPDGKYLYFASNRGGSMNFWRVAVDEKTGVPQGEPTPFTTPSMFSQNLTVSADGKTFAYVQTFYTGNIIQAGFNPQSETFSRKTIPLAPGARIDRNPAISPDGEWLAFDAIKDKQEDLFLMRRDGTDLLQLTNDAYKDRAPRWSPDGKKIIFYSDRPGKTESWTINPNGSDARQITFESEPYGLLAFWSPDGKKLVQNVSQNYPKIYNAEKPLTEQTPVQVPDEKNPDVWAMAFSWSPDGEKIASIRMKKKADDDFGITIYSVASNKHDELLNFGDSPVWLNDSRRLIFFHENKIFLLDTVTRKTKKLLELPPTETLQGITVSPDNRFVYFSIKKQESNIWLGSFD